MSGDRATFLGDQLAAVVQAIAQVADSLGQPPVVVGGLAVLARLSTPHRATVDLDVVDRMLGTTPHLEVLRAVEGATAEEPAAVLLPTPLGMVKVDVLQVRQVELDHPQRRSRRPAPCQRPRLGLRHSDTDDPRGDRGRNG